MCIEKTLAFTRQLEKSLETLLVTSYLSEDKKIDIENKLKLVSNFNKQAFLNETNKLKA